MRRKQGAQGDRVEGFGADAVPVREPVERAAAQERQDRLDLMARRPGRARLVVVSVVLATAAVLILVVGARAAAPTARHAVTLGPPAAAIWPSSTTASGGPGSPGPARGARCSGH